MDTQDVQVREGLEGVVAFATEIAEPDRDGGALRYRGVDLRELAGVVPFERVWGLLVDGRPDRELQPAGTHPLAFRTGDARVDVQAAIAALAPEWGFRPLVDISPEVARDQLARTASATLSFVAQAARREGMGLGSGDGPARDGGRSSQDGRRAGEARGGGARASDPRGPVGRPPVPQSRIDEGRTLAERFLIRWRGEVDPDHARAIDAYWTTAAEHGMNASTFAARVVASTGADVAAALSAAVGALSGPLHGGAPARVLRMLDDVEREGDAERYVASVLDRGERLMGFGHRVYRAEDPRARALRAVAEELGSPRVEVALELERAALAALAAAKPDRVLATNVEFWSAVVLDHAQVPQELFLPLFACARTAGWSAHVLEQRRTGRLLRPSAAYVGAGPRAYAATLDA